MNEHGSITMTRLLLSSTPKGPELEVPVNEHRNDEGIDRGNRGGLGRRECPDIRCRQDDHHEQAGPDGVSALRPSLRRRPWDGGGRQAVRRT